jgi:hypothetical protein
VPWPCHIATFYLDPPTIRAFGLWIGNVPPNALSRPTTRVFVVVLLRLVVAQVNVTAICTVSSFNWVGTLNTFCDLYLIRWPCIQTFNSIGQSPCTVTAYMLATCNFGCEIFNCLRVWVLSSHLPCSWCSRSVAVGRRIHGPEP